MVEPQQVLKEMWKCKKRLKGRGKKTNREAGQDLYNNSQTSGKFGFVAQTHLQTKSFTLLLSSCFSLCMHIKFVNWISKT